jgi:hypothetical protein
LTLVRSSLERPGLFPSALCTGIALIDGSDNSFLQVKEYAFFGSFLLLFYQWLKIFTSRYRSR